VLVTSERRTDADIRADIAFEREQLVRALRDLRADVAAKRRVAALAGLAAGVGVALAFAIRARCRR
jgi:hypothetical protein